MQVVYRPRVCKIHCPRELTMAGLLVMTWRPLGLRGNNRVAILQKATIRSQATA